MIAVECYSSIDELIHPLESLACVTVIPQRLWGAVMIIIRVRADRMTIQNKRSAHASR